MGDRGQPLPTRRDDAELLSAEVDADSLFPLSYLAGHRNEEGNHQQESNPESCLCTVNFKFLGQRAGPKASFGICPAVGRAGDSGSAAVDRNTSVSSGR